MLLARAASPDSLVAEATELGPGRYRWQVLAVGGHITRGDTFSRRAQSLAPVLPLNTIALAVAAAISAVSTFHMTPRASRRTSGRVRRQPQRSLARGHANITITLAVYAAYIPNMQVRRRAAGGAWLR